MNLLECSTHAILLKRNQGNKNYIKRPPLRQENTLQNFTLSHDFKFDNTNLFHQDETHVNINNAKFNIYVIAICVKKSACK